MLEVWVGQQPDSLQYYGTPMPTTPSIPIHSPLFTGHIRISLQHPHQPPLLPLDKLFSIQFQGHFHTFTPAPNQPHHACLSMDDVMMGIELNKDLTRTDVNLPIWIIKAVEYWIRKMNAQVRMENVLVDVLGSDSISSCSPLGPGTGAKLFVPLVCGATFMTARPRFDPASASSCGFCGGDGGFESPASLYHSSYCLTSSVPLTVQHHQRHAEWSSLLHVPPLYIYQQARPHVPIVMEHNAFLFASYRVLQRYPSQSCWGDDGEAGWDQSPSDRRALLRHHPSPSLLSSLYSSHHSHHSHSSHSHHSHSHGPMQEVTGQVLRQSVPFSPALEYAFELSADYFDFSTFILKPRWDRPPSLLLPPHRPPSSSSSHHHPQHHHPQHHHPQHHHPQHHYAASASVGGWHPTSKPPSVMLKYFGNLAIHARDILRQPLPPSPMTPTPTPTSSVGVDVGALPGSSSGGLVGRASGRGMSEVRVVCKTRAGEYIWVVAFRLYD